VDTRATFDFTLLYFIYTLISTFTTSTPSSFTSMSSSTASERMEPRFEGDDNITHSALTTPAATRPSSPVHERLPPSPLSTGRHKVAVIGSGSWGTALAKIAAQNVAKNYREFHSEVRMWVRQKHVGLSHEGHATIFKFYEPSRRGDRH
jgi:glycerol-3-phosphate dehydrogenase (NAD+)